MITTCTLNVFFSFCKFFKQKCFGHMIFSLLAGKYWCNGKVVAPNSRIQILKIVSTCRNKNFTYLLFSDEFWWEPHAISPRFFHWDTSLRYGKNMGRYKKNSSALFIMAK